MKQRLLSTSHLRVALLSWFLLAPVVAQEEAGDDGQDNNANKADVPVSAVLLRNWLDVSGDADLQGTAFASYRRSVTRNKNFDWVEQMNAAMRNFARKRLPELDAKVLDSLLASGLALGAIGGQSYELMPWLLMAKKIDPADLRVRFLLCEAWGRDSAVRDFLKARAECEVLTARLSQKFEEELPKDVTQFLRWLPATSSFADPKDALAWSASALSSARSLFGEGKGIGPRWLVDARLAELDQAYEDAVRDGDKSKAMSVIANMETADPEDPSYKLLRLAWSMSLPVDPKVSKRLAADCRRAVKALPVVAVGTGLSRETVSRRLGRLGVVGACQALELDVDDPDVWLSEKASGSRRVYLFPDAGTLKLKVRSIEKTLRTARAKLAEYEATVTKYKKQREGLLSKARQARSGADRAALVNQARTRLSDIEKVEGYVVSKQSEIDGHESALKWAAAASERMRNFRLN